MLPGYCVLPAGHGPLPNGNSASGKGFRAPAPAQSPVAKLSASITNARGDSVRVGLGDPSPGWVVLQDGPPGVARGLVLGPVAARGRTGQGGHVLFTREVVSLVLGRRERYNSGREAGTIRDIWEDAGKGIPAATGPEISMSFPDSWVLALGAAGWPGGCVCMASYGDTGASAAACSGGRRREASTAAGVGVKGVMNCGCYDWLFGMDRREVSWVDYGERW